MVKKLFALASVTALAGLVSAVSAAGCSVTAVETTPVDSGTGDAKKPPIVAGDGGDEPVTDCKATGKFAPEVLNPPVAQQSTACTAAIITTLSEACANDPGGKTDATCATARAVAANKTCAECIFGQKADAQWKVITLDPGGTPPATFNQAGCVEYVTAVKGCGQAYSEVSDCISTYCSKCTGSEFTDCNKTVLGEECADYGLDGPCGNAYTAKRQLISDTCFPKTQDEEGIKELFTKMATIGCMAAAKAGADAADADAN